MLNMAPSRPARIRPCPRRGLMRPIYGSNRAEGLWIGKSNCHELLIIPREGEDGGDWRRQVGDSSRMPAGGVRRGC